MNDTPRWIAEAAGLQALAPLLDQAPWLAFDTESNSMHVYQERVCLMQLNIGGELVVIDPLPLGQGREALGPLADYLEDPARPVWLHGGEYDVVCMDRDYQCRIRGVFDTQQASSLLGWKRTGYGSVVEEVCAVSLPKGHSDYDWATRPLDPAALQYAVDDVRYLPQVVEHLRRAVQEADLEDETAIANTAVESVSARAPGYDPADIWRLKGVSDVPNRHLPVLVALHRWRDDTARELDRPPGRVVANEALVALARQAPTNFGLLKRMRIKSGILRHHGDAILATVKAAQDDPPAIPEAPARREPDPRERDREKALKRWRREESERRGVTMQVVLPARSLEYLKRHGAADLAAVPQLGAKRIARYGDQLQRLACS